MPETQKLVRGDEVWEIEIDNRLVFVRRGKIGEDLVETTYVFSVDDTSDDPRSFQTREIAARLAEGFERDQTHLPEAELHSRRLVLVRWRDTLICTAAGLEPLGRVFVTTWDDDELGPRLRRALESLPTLRVGDLPKGYEKPDGCPDWDAFDRELLQVDLRLEDDASAFRVWTNRRAVGGGLSRASNEAPLRLGTTDDEILEGLRAAFEEARSRSGTATEVHRHPQHDALPTALSDDVLAGIRRLGGSPPPAGSPRVIALRNGAFLLPAPIAQLEDTVWPKDSLRDEDDIGVRFMGSAIEFEALAKTGPWYAIAERETHFHYVIRLDDPDPADPRVSWLDHDGSDDPEEVSKRHESAWRLSQILQELEPPDAE